MHEDLRADWLAWAEAAEAAWAEAAEAAAAEAARSVAWEAAVARLREAGNPFCNDGRAQ